MKLVPIPWAFALIVGTWLIALALTPWVADRTDGAFWPVPLVLALGCSGSIAAVVVA